MTDKSLSELTVEEHARLQALVPAGGFSAFTCSPFTDDRVMNATAMDASFRLTQLYELVPVR